MSNKYTAKSVNNKNKHRNLVLGIVFDLIGMTSYIIPGIAEFIDIVWAPIASLLLMYMYKGNTGKIGALLGFVEEILPETDFIPTFTLTWIYTYVIQNTEDVEQERILIK
jgi:hypothetical protein